jgi:hypothetical protein
LTAAARAGLNLTHKSYRSLARVTCDWTEGASWSGGLVLAFKKTGFELSAKMEISRRDFVVKYFVFQNVLLRKAA